MRGAHPPGPKSRLQGLFKVLKGSNSITDQDTKATEQTIQISKPGGPLSPCGPGGPVGPFGPLLPCFPPTPVNNNQ